MSSEEVSTSFGSKSFDLTLFIIFSVATAFTGYALHGFLGVAYSLTLMVLATVASAVPVGGPIIYWFLIVPYVATQLRICIPLVNVVVLIYSVIINMHRQSL